MICLLHESGFRQVHASHGQVVLFRVIHQALSAFGGFRLVHVVVGIDFGVVILQCVTVHQVAHDKRFSRQERRVARSVSDRVKRHDAMGERVVKVEQMQFVAVNRDDRFLQVVVRNLVQPGVTLDFA